MTDYVNLKYHYYNNISSNDNLVLKEFLKDVNDNMFIKNRTFLINSTSTKKILFDSKWNQNPQQFCIDFYKTQYYFPIILLVNSVPTVFDFVDTVFETRPIIAPSLKDILQLLG